MKMRALLSVSDAARAVGKHPQWLRRRLLEREREVGRHIMVRVGEGTRRLAYKVTLHDVLHHEPGLALVRQSARRVDAKRDEAVYGALVEVMADFRQTLEALVDRVEQLEFTLGKLSEVLRTGRGSAQSQRK